MLSAVNAEAELGQFKNALDKYSDEELGSKFPQLRDLISKTILGLSQDGYRLKSASPESPCVRVVAARIGLGTLGARTSESGSIRTSVQRPDSGAAVAAGEFLGGACVA